MKIGLMKPIFVMISLLSLCCFVFGGCSEAALTEEEIFEKHIQTMEALEADRTFHCRLTATYEFDGELTDELIWDVWSSGQNSYNESIYSDGTAAPSGLFYGGDLYSFHQDGSLIFQRTIEKTNTKRYDEAAEILACEMTDTGYMLTTAAEWLIGHTMGMWLCENAQITYTYDRDWVLQEVRILSQLTPDPDKAELIQDVESGVCTEVYRFDDTEKAEITVKIDEIWEKARANVSNESVKSADFDLAIEKLAARTTCHTSEEFVTIYPDEEVTLNIDRMYADSDALYTWAQNGSEISAIVECGGKRFERVYYAEEWESSDGSTSLPPYHIKFLPEHYIVEAIEETADGITVKCQADTSKADVEFVEATAEFLFDADWNALEYSFFNSYMIENHDGEEILLSYKNHVTFLATEENDIRQTIEDTFAEAKASAE